jgi:hypothetical protein
MWKKSPAKTSTMQQKLSEAAAGFKFLSLTVASTAYGGKELAIIASRAKGK